MNALLEVENLVAGYGQTEILRSVSVAVAEGEIVSLLGSNGAGKTTFNHAVAGTLAPRGGLMRFAGKDRTGAPTTQMVAEGLIQVPEGRRVFPNLSVRENLWLGGYRRGSARRTDNLARVVGIFPRLGERLTQLAGTLSGGEQQMLAIGRGLMAEPRLLILDEPSLGLSPLLVEEMFGLIRGLNAEGLAILLVEQNVVQSLEIAARAYVMENGAIVASGSAAALRDDPALKKAYLGM
ncbi:MAG: ABC transporter ATP-binding protein [Alphaproteobacteria bacterium]|nr:ABC transporter ATP-binding protein [Alphaproteobacteria bacterium]